MNKPSSLLHIDRYLCSDCGMCVVICETGALCLCEGAPSLVYPELCGGCSLCEEVCPEGAIECGFAIVWDEPGLGEANRA